MTKQYKTLQNSANNLMHKSLSILLVDDNKVNQFLGKRILQNLGITNIVLAGNGNEALELVINGSYDILLTDVEMPGMNGYELSAAIREKEAGEKKIIIIALTANASEEDREKAVVAGIDDYITKPYSPQDLMYTLQKNLLENRPFMVEDFGQAIKEKPNEGIKNVYSVFRDNKEDVKQFLHMLSGQLPELIQQIKTGIITENWDLSFQAAHKLKSPVKMLSSVQLFDKLSVFTEDLKERKNLNLSPENFETIAPELESLLVMVNKELEDLTSF
jgi:CheY-like chemotaxis protein/HPt (histidine-containing phosphotransfer) domain-containing protein